MFFKSLISPQLSDQREMKTGPFDLEEYFRTQEISQFQRIGKNFLKNSILRGLSEKFECFPNFRHRHFHYLYFDPYKSHVMFFNLLFDLMISFSGTVLTHVSLMDLSDLQIFHFFCRGWSEP